MSLGFVFGLNLILSAGFTYAIIRSERKLSWGIDSTHGVPRVGGLAIIVSVLLVSVLASDLPRDALTALVAGGVVAAVGLLDDLGCGRGPLLKLAVSLAVAAATVALTDVYVSHINTPVISKLFDYRPLAISVSILALAGMCHGVNLIDGLHGLALSFAVIAFGALSIIAFGVNEPKIALLALSLLGACLGLMIFNFPSGSIFLGDVGSYFIGFTAAWIAIYLCHQHAEVSPWAMVCIFAYPIVDVGYSAARRGLRGHNPMRGDKEHLHHRLLRLKGRLRPNYPRETAINTTLSCAILGFMPAAIAAINFDQPPVLIALSATSIATLAVINWIASFVT
ncbi:undecaprenyl/decaprenyl-phosphate alpha-N-acetylglucosaminyl 1-phosphate transferase [Planktomarina temperata]|nr:undecaprenyl/decaprenyl-phosphate alpha-N-acetylglucosaminyl 1-phosphate transferase [Planktomarina temperata]